MVKQKQVQKQQAQQTSNLIYGFLVVTVLVIFGLMFLFSNGNDGIENNLALESNLSPQVLDSQSLDNNASLDVELSEDSSLDLNQAQQSEPEPSQINQAQQQLEPETSNMNQTQTTSDSTQTLDKTDMNRPEMMINPDQEYRATMQTNLGTIKLQLFAQQTPQTVNNFVYLAQNNFYDGLTFHRIIEDFMIQGGCPLGEGTGDPGYQFEDEDNPEPLVKGSLAMANSGPNTNGSQFFIVTADAAPWLDGKHTHFGQVMEGMDIVKVIDQMPTNNNDQPQQDVIIKTLTIETL